jgi:CheY-like chemotaxis protein
LRAKSGHALEELAVRQFLGGRTVSGKSISNYEEASSHSESPPMAPAPLCRSGQARTIVYIIDRRAFGRDCLAAALRAAAGDRLIETFSDVNELQKKDAHQPHASLILLCHHETDAGSLEDELLVLKNCLKATPIIFLSDAEDAGIILRALASGARGYIPANLPLTVAIQAMQVVEAGGT